eukprot:437513_1
MPMQHQNIEEIEKRWKKKARSKQRKIRRKNKIRIQKEIKAKKDEQEILSVYDNTNFDHFLDLQDCLTVHACIKSCELTRKMNVPEFIIKLMSEFAMGYFCKCQNCQTVSSLSYENVATMATSVQVQCGPYYWKTWIVEQGKDALGVKLVWLDQNVIIPTNIIIMNAH